MSKQLIIGTVLLACALFLGMSGVSLINDPAASIRVSGQAESVSGKPGAMEVSLSAGQPFFFQGTQSNGNWNYCLDWQTEYGSASVTVEARVLNRQTMQWQDVNPRQLCARGEQYAVEFTSARDQVIRYSLYLQRAWRGVLGGTSPICSGCQGMRSFAEVSSPEAAQQRGVTRLAIAGILGSAGLVFCIGISALMTFCYAIAKALLPSPKIKNVREEMRRSTDPFSRYDSKVNQSYRDPEPSDFRRRQDTEDLGELVSEAKGQLKRAQAELRRTQADNANNTADFEEAEAAFNAAVKRAKEAQAAMEAARKRKSS